jgi:hypothetical protein
MAVDRRSVGIDFSSHPWAVPDAEALSIIPKVGIFPELIENLRDSTDAPVIYHIGSLLSIFSTALSQCRLYVTTEMTKDKVICKEVPLIIWSAIIGDSGDRKSAAMGRAVRILSSAKAADRLMPFDGSQEAWHATLGAQNNALLYREELSGLLDATMRSYSPTMRSWLLETWAGERLSRVTKSSEEEIIERPRLSILGGIPPTTFGEKTKREDWRSGFLARFSFFAGRRETWMPNDTDPFIGKGVKWLSQVALASQCPIYVVPEASKLLAEWIYDEVELQRTTYRPEVLSNLQRLQDTGAKIGAILAMTGQYKPVFSPENGRSRVLVEPDTIAQVLPLLNVLKRTVVHLFGASSKNAEKQVENEVVSLLKAPPRTQKAVQRGVKHVLQESSGISINSIAELCDLTYARAHKIVQSLLQAGLVTPLMTIPSGRGRPTQLYKWTNG